jgi:hypothetical protein
MFNQLYDKLFFLPDGVILLIGAASFGAIGGLIAFLSYRFWFQRSSSHSQHEEKLADTAHNSLLGIIAFIVALSTTSVFSNLAKTEEAVRREGLEISRLGRELDALGQSGDQAKRALSAYARTVANDEWPRLARKPNSLSPVVQQNVDDLWKGIRAAQRDLGGSNSNARDDLSKYLMAIEQLREDRLAAATNSIPDVFWLCIFLFFAVECFLSGRNSFKRYGIQINMIHMATLGLLIALIMIVDNPFRGETSVSSDIILNALQK